MRSLFSVLLIAGVTGPAGLQAAALAPPCNTAPLSVYLVSGFSCSVGILNFGNFHFNVTGSGETAFLDPTQIQVTPVTVEANLGGGFNFSAISSPYSESPGFSVGPGEFANYTIDWLEVIDAGPRGSSADMSMDPPFGNVTITQDYCPDGSITPGSCVTTGDHAILTVTAPPCNAALLPADCTAHHDFSPPIQNFAVVVTKIVITGGAQTPSGFDSLTGTTSIVQPPPTLSKSFGQVSIGSGSSTTLTFTLQNPNDVVTLHGLQFSDILPPGLVVSTPNGLTGTCGGGVINAAGNTITLTGAALGPHTTCTFSVNVTGNGAALGSLTNTTSTVTSAEGQAADPAVATVFVGNPYQVSYAANLSAGDSVVNISNTGARGASLQSGTTAAITGALCANVYAFTPDEQLVSCCSCPVTPNGLASLSVKNDLASNTLTPAVPTALVIKLLATVPVGGTCNNSAAAVGTAALSNGLAAFETTIHATPAAGTFGVTETPFSPATLSAGELNRLGSLCNFILANGSGFGVCRSCRLGGLGAERQ